MRLASGAASEKFTPRGVSEAPRGQGCPIRIAAKENRLLAPKLGRLHRRVGVEGGGGRRFNGVSRLRPLEPAPSPLVPPPPEAGRAPRPVRDDLWLFAPSRDSQGGSAWLLQSAAGDLLIDCPGYTEANLAFLAERARRGPGRIVLTGREGHGRVRRLQQALGWPVLVQEQEAYLLPGVDPLQRFATDLELAPGLRLLWTPGPSPGSCVLHAAPPAITAAPLLFCGRLLVPVAEGRLAPLPSRRCFHWPRQWRSLERLRAWLPAEGPLELATGAGLGALRGGRLVAGGLDLLASLRPPTLDAAAPQGV